jgi:AAA domain
VSAEATRPEDELHDLGPTEDDQTNPTLTTDVDDYFASLQEGAVDAALDEADPTRRTSWTAADLLAAHLPEPRWAVEELLPEGLTFMCGAPKLGKSWLALAIGIALAAGGYALGKIQVDRGDVLYLALEDNPRRLQGRLRMLLGSDSAPDGLYVETEWERFDEGGLDRLTAWLDAHPAARLVLIDVWTRVRPITRENGNRYQADYDAAAALQAVAIKYGVAIIALYHTRKAEAADFVETVQGTFGTAGAADTIVVVKRSRGEADATLFITGRDVAETELALRFAAETGAWELLGDAAEYGLGKTRAAILELLVAHGPLSPKQVSDLAPDISHELAKKTMQRMFSDGQVTASKGVYTAVPAVPASLEEGSMGTEGQRGHWSTVSETELEWP